MKLVITSILLVSMCSQSVATPPPAPEYISLTRVGLAQLRFEYSQIETPDGSYFYLDYPAEIDDAYLPYSVKVTTKGLNGLSQSRIISAASDKHRHIEVFFDLTHDADVSVIFVCNRKLTKPCQGEREYGIHSILSFMKIPHKK